jgi:HEAT repeat protein
MRWFVAFPATVLFFALLPAQGYQAESPSAKDRKKEASDLSKQGAQAIPRLAELVSDPDGEVRLEAVKSLVEVGGLNSLPPLIKATADNSEEIQVRAVDGLVNFYYPGYVKTGLSAAGSRLKSVFKDDTEYQAIEPYVNVEPNVIQAIGKVATGGITMLSRANACRALGVLRAKAALPDLITAIRTKNSDVIYQSLIALQKLRDISAGPQILFLLRDLEERIQVKAIETVGLLRTMEAAPELRAILNKTDDKDVRRAALSSLAMLPDPQNRPIFWQYMRDGDSKLRAAAAEGLGRIGNSEDVNLVNQQFSSEGKREVRLAQAFALVMLGNHSYSEFSPLKYLVDSLNNGAWKGVADGYLVELARKQAVREVLYQALPQGTSDEKIMLAHVLARSGDKDTVPVLEKLARDPNIEVANEGAQALRNLSARLR